MPIVTPLQMFVEWGKEARRPSRMVLWAVPCPEPHLLSPYPCDEVQQPPTPYWWFQFPTVNWGSQILNRNKQYMHFKLHATPSSMIKSRAVPLCLTWNVNHPVASQSTLYTLPAHSISHLVALLVIRSIAMVSQGSCSNNPYFIVIFLYHYIIIHPLYT